MPVKFGKSQSLRNRETGKVTVVHKYMKSTPTPELVEAMDKSNTTPKLRQKIKNELVRRKKL